jgi:GR25 family glycosyltransferase involved in LPS biosynthesis
LSGVCLTLPACHLKKATGMDVIAHVYYINLDMRPDRAEHMELQLRGCPWPYTRISAVRLTVQPEQLGIKLKNYARNVPHVASIFLSHKKSLEAMLKSEQDGIFILLEDDVKIDPKIFSSVSLIPDDLPKDWDVGLVSARFRESMLTGPNGEKPEWPWRWVRDCFTFNAVSAKKMLKSGVISGAHFCIFPNKKAVRKIFQKMESAPVIWDVDSWYTIENDCYVWNHPYVGQAHLGSNHTDLLKLPK